jgi:hypothetical protein
MDASEPSGCGPKESRLTKKVCKKKSLEGGGRERRGEDKRGVSRDEKPVLVKDDEMQKVGMVWKMYFINWSIAERKGTDNMRVMRDPTQ